MIIGRRYRTAWLFAVFTLVAVSNLAVLPVQAQQAAFPSAVQPGGPRLVGTFTGTAFSGAVIEDAGGAQTFYRLHERLPDGSRLLRIGGDSALIEQPDGSRAELIVAPGMSRVARPVPSPPEPSPAATRPQEPAPRQDPPRKRPRSRRLIEEE